MPLQHAIDARELLEGLGQRPLHRWLVRPCLGSRRLRDLLRSADAGDHVLALGIDQELAVELLVAGRRIARERHPRRRGLAHIAEHHGLDVNRSSPTLRDVV